MTAEELEHAGSSVVPPGMGRTQRGEAAAEEDGAADLPLCQEPVASSAGAQRLQPDFPLCHPFLPMPMHS